MIICTRQGLRLVTGIGFCVVSYLIRDREYDLLRILGSASCDFLYEIGDTICHGHWFLYLEISQTR